MLKQLLTLILSVSAVAYADTVSVFFDTDKTVIKPDYLHTIIDTAAHIKDGGSLVIISGYADKRGSESYNFKLAQKRAEAVKTELVSLGVNSEQIAVVVSNGKLAPKAPDDNNPEHLKVNRRVDIVCLDPVTKVETKRVPYVDVYPVKVEKLVIRRHRVSLLGGFGPSGLNRRDLSPGVYKVTQDYDFEAGLGYQFLTPLVDNRLSIGANGFTNKNIFLSVGLDF